MEGLGRSKYWREAESRKREADVSSLMDGSFIRLDVGSDEGLDSTVLEHITGRKMSGEVYLYASI